MNRNPVGWFEIYTNDLERARAFYEAMLGVTLEPLPSNELSMYSFPMNPETHGSSGALAHVDGVEAGNNSTMVYFSVEDCAVEGDRIQSAGGELVREKTSIGDYGFVVIGTDTEGNRFGLHSMR